ncbi:uncharacterized protein LOC112194578 [Rosa chinensis]|uniref:uncharacterized protein LOC112163968 n=1 Tax=Rosa chinensis TaxID=74649 RepID=UPI000D090643|nr:uncharacterized protein LOC112163968 [Rosa chinensis]XP_024155991.1 uncharacterized protein LOC112163969 [Rosa chinensis]XP_024177672.1 uncharacterized protein LOC112183519 [Rosa chinensis]XP_024190568.1 uncharacterized protein LOC112194578 [Rosa chinensis]
MQSEPSISSHNILTVRSKPYLTYLFDSPEFPQTLTLSVSRNTNGARASPSSYIDQSSHPVLVQSSSRPRRRPVVQSSSSLLLLIQIQSSSRPRPVVLVAPSAHPDPVVQSSSSSRPVVLVASSAHPDPVVVQSSSSSRPVVLVAPSAHPDPVVQSSSSSRPRRSFCSSRSSRPRLDFVIVVPLISGYKNNRGAILPFCFSLFTGVPLGYIGCSVGFIAGGTGQIVRGIFMCSNAYTNQEILTYFRGSESQNL